MCSVFYIWCSNFGLICVPEQKLSSEDQVQAKNVGHKRKDGMHSLSGVGAAEGNAHQKRNKNRKRKEVKDLRFDTTELGITSSKRKERKKQ